MLTWRESFIVFLLLIGLRLESAVMCKCIKLTLVTGVTVSRGHLNVIGGEQASSPIDFALPPVRVALVKDSDQLIR